MTAQTQPHLKTLQFRNGLYQGQTLHEQPHGIGLLLDDYMRFYVSEWRESQLNGRTLIFNGHGKYLYGIWHNGQPNGFNIFRSGDIVLLGHFLQGELTGEFIVVFERQNLLAVVASNPSQQSYTIKRKLEFLTEDDIKKVSQTLSFTTSVPRDFFSLLKFIKMSFVEQRVPLRFVFDDVEYRFGFDHGLSICFNDDNFINKLGWMNSKGQLTGLGATYGLTHGAFTEQGNFQTKSTIKYKTHRPQNQIKSLLSISHRKSVEFTNDYIDYGGVYHIQRLDQLLRHNVISQLVDNPLNLQVNYSEKQLNDSLQYYPKNKLQGLKLALIRETLYKSVGRIGSQMISANKDPSIKPIKFSERPKHLHYTPDKEEERSYTLEQSHKEILESLNSYKYQTADKRKHKHIIQKQVDLRQAEYTQNIHSMPQKFLTPTKPLKQDQIKTTAKKQASQPNRNIIQRQHPKNIPQTQRSLINQFIEQYQQPKQDLPLMKPSKLPNLQAQSENQKLYKQISKLQSLHKPMQSPPKKEKTPIKSISRQPAPIIIKAQNSPKFNGGDSPHNEMDINHEESLLQNPSSRRFIPVVHQPIYYKPSTNSKSPTRHCSPKPNKKTYSQLHKKQKEKVSKGGYQQNTTRPISKSPIRTTSVNPIQQKTSPMIKPIQQLPKSNPTQLQQTNLDANQLPISIYFRHQQQRFFITDIATQKQDYYRNV